MMRRYLVVAGLAVSMTLPLVARAQSLADVAKAEEARRKALKQPVAKVLTNDDMKPSDHVPEGAASASTASTPAATATPSGTATAAAAAAAPAEDDPTKTEKYWHDRITGSRTALDHDKVLVDAIQSRINALNTDFVNTSDPAQRALVDSNRNTAIAELDRLNKDIQAQTKAVSDIQEEARKARIPAGWLR